MGSRWGLSASPLSAAFRARLLARYGDDLDVAILSEMRRATPLGLVASLRRVRAEHGFVLVEDSAATPLLPVLKFLLSLTRCRALGVVDRSAEPTPFARWRGLIELPALGWASLVGAWSAARCYLELRRLARTRRAARRLDRPPPTCGSA